MNRKLDVGIAAREAVKILKDTNERYKIGASNREIETMVDAAENNDFAAILEKHTFDAEKAGTMMASVIKKITRGEV